MDITDRSWLKNLLEFLGALRRRWARLRLEQAAASLAFLSLLAIVPVISIAISLLGSLPMFADLRGAGLAFLASNLFLPNFSETIVSYLNQFADKVGELSALGASVFFATAFSALRTIDGTLNQIWGVNRPSAWGRRLTVYWTFLTLGPLLVTGSAAVNTMLVSEVLAGVSLPALEAMWVLAVPWLSTLLGLTLLYRLVPNASVSWRDAFFGAMVAAITLELLKRGMGMQLARLPTYTIVYGAFAVLPMFFIWIFLLWLTVLAGALVTATLPSWSMPQTRTASSSAAQRFERALAVLHALCDAITHSSGAVQAANLRKIFSDDARQAAETAELLSSLGYLQRAWKLDLVDAGLQHEAIWEELWMLAPEARNRTPRALFEQLWRADGGPDALTVEPLDLSVIDRPLLQDR